MLCNMDNYIVSRVFDLRMQPELREGDKLISKNFEYFLMQSRIDGEFGPVILNFVAQIDISDMHLQVDVVSDSGENLDRLFEFRYKEMLFFIGLLNLFKPCSHEILSFSPEKPSSDA